jgi:hypothetical protein
MTAVLGSCPSIALGQSGGGGTGAVLVWSLVLIFFLVLGFVAVSYVRKWVKDEREPNHGPGFTLGDLRRMHQRGQMTDQEFEKARNQMIAATQRAAERAAEAAREAAKQRGGGLSEIEEIRARARRAKSLGTDPQVLPDTPPAPPPLPPPPPSSPA